MSPSLQLPSPVQAARSVSPTVAIPWAQLFSPEQRVSHWKPLHCMRAPQLETPLHVTLFTRARALTPLAQDERPAQFTVQLSPAHWTTSAQDPVPWQSTAHPIPSVQSMPPLQLPAPQEKTHDCPAGQFRVVAQALGLEQVKVQVSAPTAPA
jgi:hypothetical protein